MKACDIVSTAWGSRFMGRHFPSSIGRNGLTTRKREGDGASPVGTHRIVGMLYRPDRIAAHHLPTWARPIRLNDLWSDASDDVDYNQLVRAPYGFSHEKLRRADPLYDLILITDWNWPEAQPGQGSAIFLHIWRRPRHGTEGCVAFSREDLIWIANRLTPHSRLILQG